MSLLPDFALDDEVIESEEVNASAIDIPKEFGIDFNTGQPTGEIVEGLEAIKVWIWLALHIERYRFGIYSWDYGAELEQYIGRSYSSDYLNATVKQSVIDCLKQNEHIENIEDFTATVSNGKLSMSFIVITDIGGIDINV